MLTQPQPRVRRSPSLLAVDELDVRQEITNMKTLSMLVAAILCWFAFTTTIYARLGETREECLARYGAITSKIDADTFSFRKGMFVISVHFTDNRADYIDYSRDTKFSKNQIDELLARNLAGTHWNVTGIQGADPKMPAALVSQDGEFLASVGFYSGNTRMTLSIYTKAWDERTKQKFIDDTENRELSEIDGL